MSNVPEGNDSEFTWESFQQTVNKDLSDVLGNFVSRVTKFCNSKWGAVVPMGSDFHLGDKTHITNTLPLQIKVYQEHMAAMEFRKAAQALREIWTTANVYLQECEPWVLYKTNPDEAARVIRLSLNMIVLFANLSAPFIPDTARKIHEAMGTEPSWHTVVDSHVLKVPVSESSVIVAHDMTNIRGLFQSLPAGKAYTIPQNLFEKITDDQVAELSARFSGES